MESEDTEALGGARLRHVKQMVFKCRLKVSVDLHDRVLSGNEFQTDGAATEKARRAVSVLVMGTDSRSAWEDRSSIEGSAIIRSLK